jgi:hypothetical protein
MGEFWFGGVIGIFAGFVVGHVSAQAGRARSDLKATKESVPKLRTQFRDLFLKTVGRWALIGAIVIAVGYIALRTPE